MSKSDAFILTSSTNENRYVYDRRKNSALLLNPILHFLLKLLREGTGIREWIDRIESFPVEIDGCGPVSKKELEYYYRKYLFLKESGYFSEPAAEDYSPDPMAPEMIEYALANNRQVTFEVTERCNLNCLYCGYGNFYKSHDDRNEADLEIDKAKRLLSFMANYWNSPLNVSKGKLIYIGFYGGEPLLNIRFVKEIARFAKGLKLDFNRLQFSMTTNALLLEKYMDFIAENEFNLLISLDGNEENNGYRVYKNGEPAFTDILRNIKALRDCYPDYFREKVNFNSVLHDKNSVEETLAFIDKTFGKIPRIGEIKNIGIKDSRQRDFLKIYSDINQSLDNSANPGLIKKEMFIKLPDIKNMSAFVLKYSGFVFEDYRHLASYEAFRKPYPTGTCLPFSKKIFVTAGGELLPCETIVRTFFLGKITPDAVELDFAGIAKKYNEYFNHISAQCGKCFNKEACGACIFNLMETGIHPVCVSWMDYSRFSRYLAWNLGAFEKEPHLYSQIIEDVTVES